jgi:hypothetical protein
VQNCNISIFRGGGCGTAQFIFRGGGAHFDHKRFGISGGRWMHGRTVFVFYVLIYLFAKCLRGATSLKCSSNV